MPLTLPSLRTLPVFVIGTGRSGTHWLGYALDCHPEIRATVEQQPIFGWATGMAMNPALEARDFEPLVRAYRWQLLRTLRPVYLDKTHPNIWLAEKLKARLPRARFIAIERNPYATVASMMKHAGVADWHRTWRNFPVPNRFLGITQAVAQDYDDWPLPAQCALRWRAHHERLRALVPVLGEDLLMLSYEEFANDTGRVLQRLQAFLGLKAPLPMPPVQTESLDKWRDQLDADAIASVQRVTGMAPPAH